MHKTISAILLALFVGLLTGCGGGSSQEVDDNSAASTQRPNIIFIMSDDHAVDAISAYGSEVGKLAPTPNIDRLADEGAIFTRNYNTNSLCGPSRATIITGKFSHLNGFRMNGDKFDGSQITLPKLLAKADYSTAVIGKWHLGTEPTGFDHYDIFEGQGNYYNPDFIADGDSSVVKGYATDIVTDKGISWIEKQKESGKPFFLMLHQKAPHRNWMAPARYYNVYDSVEFPVPSDYFRKFDDTQKAAKNQIMTIYKDMYAGYDLKMTEKEGSPELAHDPFHIEFERMTPEERAAWDKAYQPKNDAFHKANLKGEDLARWKYQRYMQEYLATIKAVDDGVGEVLDYLEANGLAENTIVVYTSDQGFYMGENGWFDKRFMYETSFRQPFLIRYPKKIAAGKEVAALTQNLDFAETLLDYAGVEIPEDMQGKSFRPLLEGKVKDEDFRDALFYEFYDFPAFHMVDRHYGVSDGKYKLMHFYDANDYWEMYDLEKDPREHNNVYDNPEYADVQKRLQEKLNALMQEYNVPQDEWKKSSPEKIEKFYDNFQKMYETEDYFHKVILKGNKAILNGEKAKKSK
ncbi:sulfatase family protein [Fulvivirga sediminis]|uniref:Sulfatase n=1 Tax=Fulvivirga sediminis TaxID=2803949 RepID=A0A937F7E7_9BACT|nr:sulfatase [Fulvivirga sediminis]MBL3656386.1 sulfatase [Fulvivirga sediminis]